MTIALALVALLFIYPFVLYPLLARLIPSRREIRDPDFTPSLAFVICALNEERVLRQKLENTFALDYPRDRLTVYLINDGSTDSTATIAQAFLPQGLVLINRPHRRGKVANLSDLIPSLPHDFVALSDANVIYDRSALRHLMARFADPQVGCVSGKVVLVETTAVLHQSEGQYYSIEWTLQQKAADLYSMCGADGAMYAFRRHLFQPLPPDTIIEDFVAPMLIVRQGYRAVFEPAALAFEQGPQSLLEEYRRKRRIAAGAAQSLLRGNGIPARHSPLRFWFIWISHKLLRWLSPVLGLLMLLLAILALPALLALLILAAAAAITLLAALRWISHRQHPLLNAPFYFLFAQIAMAAGLWRGFRGRQSVLWEKANR